MKAKHEFSSEEAYESYLRTYIAANAVNGLLTRVPNRVDNKVDLGILECKRIAEESVIIAEELVKLLNKS